MVRAKKGVTGMLVTFFLICAIVGGALVLTQLLMSLLSIGMGRGMHLRVHHGGSVSAHPVGAGRHRFGLSTRIHSAPKSAHRVAPGNIRGHSAIARVQGMFNFQGIVAGATVMGLTGLAATSAQLSANSALAIAVAAALVMMALVEGALELMTRMENDGTIDIQQALGKPAIVYLSIPAANQGQGKVTVSLQERSMEFAAITFGDSSLATGENVIVVNILEPSVMVVVAGEKVSAIVFNNTGV
jgi:hypothetical protein